MNMRDRMNPAVFSLQRSAIREYTRLANKTPGCIKLTLGEPDFDTPSLIVESAVRSIRGGDTHYIQNSGTYDLRKAVSEFERNKNGLSYSTDEIIITSGATEALFVSLLGIIEPGDEVIIPLPAFVLYREIVNLFGGRAVGMDTSSDGFQIRKDRLKPLLNDKTKAIILNSPNNPTGCVYDKESLETVRQAVCGRDIFIISDEVYRQICYTDGCCSIAEYTDLREQTIVVQSFSKPYAMTGWRTGYLMADSGIIERLALIHQYAVVSTPAPFQKACIDALKTDPSEMTEKYRERRDYLLHRLDRIGLDYMTPEGAFYVFPSIERYGMDSGEFARHLILEAGLAVTPGLAFGCEGFIRISYCCSLEDIKTGMDRLQVFFEQTKRIRGEMNRAGCRSISEKR